MSDVGFGDAPFFADHLNLDILVQIYFPVQLSFTFFKPSGIPA
jgi:hypothetical protein